MRLPFLDREREVGRLAKALGSKEPGFIVVYGRRRCGKSRLLQEVAREGDIYHLADRRAAPLQIESLAHEISRHFPGFGDVRYPSWDTLFQALGRLGGARSCLTLDEFPYLVQVSPELPSLLQKLIDERRIGHSLIICGSSQRMMQGIVLDGSAPLYGRASEILKIRPLEPVWIRKALRVDAESAVEAYSIWGGVPRYWELARSSRSQKKAIVDLILDRNGVLHNEPERLLIDDMRGGTQANSILSLVAGGCHRLSEIAGRLNKPAVNLSKPLAKLIDLGYLRREIPHGESVKSTRRSLYKLDDPFLQFWFRYVQANRSLLERGLAQEVFAEVQKTFPAHVGAVWEDLARAATARLEIAGLRWRPAQRWWGTGRDGKPLEIDVVAESMNRKSLLLGEVKWEKHTNQETVFAKLERNVGNFPHTRGRQVVLACWLRKSGSRATRSGFVFTPSATFRALD